MKRGVLLAVLAMVAASGACSRDGLDPGEARLSVSRGGEVVAEAPGAAAKRVVGNRTFPAGTTVTVVEGTAGVELARGSQLELRRGSEVRLGRQPSLLRGDLLVSSTGDEPLTVRAAGSEVLIRGAARLSRDLAVSAASYRGRLRLSSAGRNLDIPALRQGDITSLGVVPSRPVPLDYDPDDQWDRRFLGEAIELGEELEAKSEGFTSSLRANEGTTPGYFRLLLPALEAEPGFGPPLLTEGRPPGETLVGATIAVSARGGSFVSRWRNIFAFRDEGAPWGLVALDQRVDDSGALVQSLDAAIGRANLAFAPAAPGGGPSGGGGAPSGRPAQGGRPTAGPESTSGGTTGSVPSSSPPSRSEPRVPPTTVPPVTVPPPLTPPRPPEDPQPVSPLQPVVDTITGLLGGL